MASDAPTLIPRSTLFRRGLAFDLLTRILRGQHPGGSRLIETDLAQRHGVSRTPVREALSELASLGVIELRANRGAVVLPFGRKELEEIYAMRTILEAAATRLACGRINPLKLEIMRARLSLLKKKTDERWSERAMVLDRRLHDQIAISSGNARLAREIASYRGFSQAIRLIVGDQHDAQHQAVAAHLRIVEALQDNNADAAHDAMVDHLTQTARVVADALFAPKPPHRATRSDRPKSAGTRPVH